MAKARASVAATTEAHKNLLRTKGFWLPFSAVFCRVREGYIAFVEELPGAHPHGATLEEARTSLPEAVTRVLEANRTLARETSSGQDVIRETLRVGG